MPAAGTTASRSRRQSHCSAGSGPIEARKLVVVHVRFGIEGTLESPRRPDIGLDEAPIDWIGKRSAQRCRAWAWGGQGGDRCHCQRGDGQGANNADDHAIPAGMCLSTSLGCVITPVTALAAATAGLDR